MGKGEKNRGSVFEFKGTPPIKQVVPLGLQHVVAAVVGIVTPAMIVAGSDVANLSPADTTLLIQLSLIFTGIATLLQLFTIGGWLGASLPVIMGTSFAYVPTLKAIGAEFDLPTIFGAQILGGLVAILAGVFLKKIRKFFPPIVTGTVIFSIGLSLYPTAVTYMAGGAGSKTFGDPKNWAVALFTLVVVVFCTYFTKGTMKLASILIGMAAGYLAALALGMVSFDSIAQAGYFQVAGPLHFGIKFEISACISMMIIYIVNSVQTIGDLSSTTMGGFDREPTDKELSCGIIEQGFMSVVGAVFGGLPTASYSQNVGIVTVNKVVNRIVFIFAAAVLLIAGFIPKIAALLTTVPHCVIGGATISVFATITMTGIRMITTEPLTQRTITVVGLAVALGVGVTTVAGSLNGFPNWVNTVFGSSSVVISTLTVIALNLILPKGKQEAD